MSRALQHIVDMAYYFRPVSILLQDISITSHLAWKGGNGLLKIPEPSWNTVNMALRGRTQLKHQKTFNFSFISWINPPPPGRPKICWTMTLTLGNQNGQRGYNAAHMEGALLGETGENYTNYRNSFGDRQSPELIYLQCWRCNILLKHNIYFGKKLLMGLYWHKSTWKLTSYTWMFTAASVNLSFYWFFEWVVRLI